MINGADKLKLDKIGKYLSTINLEILTTPHKIEESMVISKLTLGKKVIPITFELSNTPDIIETVKNYFDGSYGTPSKFEIEYVADLIHDAKNLFYKKRVLNL